MKREDGRKLFRAFLGNSRGTKGHDGADGGSVKGERSLYSMVEHLLSLDETAWYLYAWSRTRWKAGFPGNRSWHTAFGRQSAGEVRRS